MYCLPCSCNYTNWERSLEFPRLLFWVTAAISVWGILLLADKNIYVFFPGAIRHMVFFSNTSSPCASALLVLVYSYLYYMAISSGKQP